jgi:hypothetical protein
MNHQYYRLRGRPSKRIHRIHSALNVPKFQNTFKNCNTIGDYVGFALDLYYYQICKTQDEAFDIMADYITNLNESTTSIYNRLDLVHQALQFLTFKRTVKDISGRVLHI